MVIWDALPKTVERRWVGLPLNLFTPTRSGQLK